MSLLYNADISMGQLLPKFEISFENKTYTHENSMNKKWALSCLCLQSLSLCYCYLEKIFTFTQYSTRCWS